MNLLRTLVTVSGMTLLSRILGFVRDFVIAHSFGAGMATDAFFVAFRLPNLLRRLFAEGAFSQAFVPLLAEYRARRGDTETKQLVDRVSGVLCLCLVGTTAVGILGAPLLITVSAPGFSSDAEKFALTVELTRITFPYILFMSLVALAAGILNTWNRFLLPAFTPVLLNVSFIGMALFAAPWFDRPVLALAWAVVIGGVLQLAIQIPALYRIRMLPKFSPVWRDEGVQRVLGLMAPAILGVSVAQISLLINTIFASFLESGSVSWLYYADRLMEFPAGLLGAALGTILLPSLSRSYSSGDSQQFSSLLDWGLRLTLLLTLPASIALAVIGVPIISSLFQHGLFDANDVLRTREALSAYAIGLVGLILVKVLAPGFYSRQDIRTPVRIAISCLVATQLMNIVFVIWLEYAHAGLALSIGLASCLNAGLLWHSLWKSGVYVPLPGWGSFLVKLLIALFALFAALYLGMGAEDRWLSMPGNTRIMNLLGLVALGVVSYFSTLWLAGFRIADFRQREK